MIVFPCVFLLDICYTQSVQACITAKGPKCNDTLPEYHWGKSEDTIVYT